MSCVDGSPCDGVGVDEKMVVDEVCVTVRSDWGVKRSGDACLVSMTEFEAGVGFFLISYVIKFPGAGRRVIYSYSESRRWSIY